MRTATWAFSLALLWGSGGAQLPLAPAGRGGQVYALVVGINNYRPYPETPQLPTLSFAESDARKLAAVFRDRGKGNSAKVRLLLDDAATKTAIEAELRELAKRLGKHDTLVLYFSGHGFPDSSGQATLIPSDGKATDEETWLPLGNLQALVGKYSSGQGKLILILDACFSGQSEPGSRSFSLPGRKAPSQTQTPTPSGENVILASSADTQPSWEDAELGGGVFTTYLLEAVSGKGDANGDGYLTLEEAYEYAALRVEDYARQKGKTQTPRLYGPGDFVLSLNPTIAAKGRLAQLKLLNKITGDQFDTLAAWVDADQPPEDLRAYLGGDLSDAQFLSLVRAGALPNVPPQAGQDPRIVKVGGLRKAGKIRLEQFWVLVGMIQAGKAPGDLSDYLSGKLREAAFLNRVRAGAVAGVPR
ncbi:MAG TPA: caspase family protein [Meiothermus sp.]|nr:caspase family protein [Meiothermus sp.]